MRLLLLIAMIGCQEIPEQIEYIPETESADDAYNEVQEDEQEDEQLLDQLDDAENPSEEEEEEEGPDPQFTLAINDYMLYGDVDAAVYSVAHEHVYFLIRGNGFMFHSGWDINQGHAGKTYTCTDEDKYEEPMQRASGMLLDTSGEIVPKSWNTISLSPCYKNAQPNDFTMEIFSEYPELSVSIDLEIIGTGPREGDILTLSGSFSTTVEEI